MKDIERHTMTPMATKTGLCHDFMEHGWERCFLLSKPFGPQHMLFRSTPVTPYRTSAVRPRQDLLDRHHQRCLSTLEPLAPVSAPGCGGIGHLWAAWPNSVDRWGRYLMFSSFLFPILLRYYVVFYLMFSLYILCSLMFSSF